jgi:hypothetical protein
MRRKTAPEWVPDTSNQAQVARVLCHFVQAASVLAEYAPWTQ